jgi:hypothetical protein
MYSEFEDNYGDSGCARMAAHTPAFGLERMGCYTENAAESDSPRPDSSVVERGPEKAGVGGSIPSLATTF